MEKVIKVWLKYYPVYLSGLWGTLWMSAVTVFLGALLGMVVALMRMSRLKILRTVFNVYVEILRGTPILLQLYFFWIGLPKLVPFELTDTQCIVAALVVNASAFISEIIRAGIGAVDKGQWEAARSIGLSETHVMTRIILPQAVKNILPALCNESSHPVKGTSGLRVLRGGADDQLQDRPERHLSGAPVPDHRGHHLFPVELYPLPAPAGH